MGSVSAQTFSQQPAGAKWQLHGLSVDHKRLFRILMQDVRRFAPQRGRSSQTNRRAYARALFASLEANTSWMAQETLAAWYDFLDDHEQLRLKNRRRVEMKNGKVIEVRDSRSPADRFYDACDLYCDTWGARSPVDRKSAGWNALVLAQALRNRITHPSKSADVSIDDRELAILERTDVWIGRMLIATLSEIQQAVWEKQALLWPHLLAKGYVPRARRNTPKALKGVQLGLALSESRRKGRADARS